MFPKTCVCSFFQMLLLRESWSELFLICAIQFFSLVDDSPLFSVTCPYESHEEDQDESNCTEDNSQKKSSSQTFTADLRLLRKIVSRFRALVVDPIEFACLKAIVIFKSDTSDLGVIIMKFLKIGDVYCVLYIGSYFNRKTARSRSFDSERTYPSKPSFTIR